MSMPDLWSPDAMVPKPRHFANRFAPADRAVAVVPRSRIPPGPAFSVYPEAFFPFRDLGVTYEAGDDSRSPAEIVDTVCRSHGITLGQLTGCRRVKNFVEPRKEAAKRLRAVGLSTTQIAKILNRDHTTVMYLLGMLKRKPKETMAREAEGK